ncbi:hypothetical protein BC829DRAFT_397358 [Chytridium lagenaria]|nr:hypothetical protein BC829DRAFT_397358 [Chytridium lagenaria]
MPGKNVFGKQICCSCVIGGTWTFFELSAYKWMMYSEVEPCLLEVWALGDKVTILRARGKPLSC